MADQDPQDEPAEEVQGFVAKRVEQFIKLREIMRAKKKAFEEEYKRFSLTEQKLNALIMGYLNEAGMESVRTAHGTCFKTTRTTASLADPDLFMKHVIETQNFDLLDRKANATAVKDYVAKNGVLPPGANLNSVVLLGVHKKA